MPEGTAGHRITNNTPKRTDINFSRAPGSMVYKGKNNTTRFVQNPSGWGPKTMHGKKIKGGEHKEDGNGGSGGETRGEKRERDVEEAPADDGEAP